MTPQSRRRPGRGGGRRRRPARSVAPPDALFGEMLRACRELLAIRSPLDAELMVSDLLGTWWGERLVDADIEEVLGEGLIDHAADSGTPAALALLTGVAYLGTPHQCARAEAAALDLIAKDVARPPWADEVGAVEHGECWVSKDVYGDQESVVCTFAYRKSRRGEERHALVALVDYNMRGMLKDAWITKRVDELRERSESEAQRDPFVRVESLRPARARAVLDAALAETDSMAHPPVNESFASYHAFVRARIRALPPGGRPAPAPTYSRDRRAALAVEFLASDDAEGLSDPSAAGRCADEIIAYGCDQDFGRPLRVSPIKVETFMLDWLPRKVLLTPEEQEAMPHVLAAWTRWAGKRTALPERSIGETLDAVWNATAKFSESFADLTLSLPQRLLERLMPDRDLEALPRRAFAFPLLEGTHGGTDLTTLDPADAADRRRLLAVEHLEHADGDREAHLDLHEAVAAQLWEGKPVETWETAQRLLDKGYERHEVLHQLMDALRHAGGRSYDLRRLRAALHHLPGRP